MSAKFVLVLILGISLGAVWGVSYQRHAILDEIGKLSITQTNSNRALEHIDSNEKLLIDKISDLLHKPIETKVVVDSDRNKSTNDGADQYLKQSEELKRLMVEIKEESQRQTAILGRTVGHDISVKIPEEINDKLSALEKRLAEKESWPHDEQEAKALRNELLDLVKNTPTWAEDEILQRLTLIRWGIQVFDLSFSTKHSPEELENCVVEYGRLIANAPDNASEELKKFTEQKLKDANKELRNHLLESAITDGNKALANGVDISEVIGRLDTFDTPETSKLKNQLTSKLEDNQIEVRLSALKNSVSESDKISDPQLKQNALMRIAEGVLELLQQVQSKGNSRISEIEALGVDCNKKITNCAETQAHLQEKLYADKQRAYQQWALKEIDAFETAFWFAEEGAKKKAKFFGENWGNDDFKKVATAITEHLNPISENLLDRPVCEIYQRSFRRGWDKIEGRQDQTEVAKQCAVVVKKSLTEMEVK